jgi:hypothetical protein
VFALSLKTASKPLAGQFERYVMGHPTLRQRVISMAQVRFCDLRTERRPPSFWPASTAAARPPARPPPPAP